MNKNILCLMALILSCQVFAKDKVTAKLIDEAVKTNQLDSLRVYLSKDITIEKSNYATTIKVVDGTIERASRKNIDRIIISKKTKGKIVEVNGPELYVSFDPECESSDCAFKFIDLTTSAYIYANARDIGYYRAVQARYNKEPKIYSLVSVSDSYDVEFLCGLGILCSIRDVKLIYNENEFLQTNIKAKHIQGF